MMFRARTDTRTRLGWIAAGDVLRLDRNGIRLERAAESRRRTMRRAWVLEGAYVHLSRRVLVPTRVLCTGCRAGCEECVGR